MLKFAVSTPLECTSETGTCPPEGSATNAGSTNSDYGGEHNCAVCESRRRIVVIEKTRAARRSRSRSRERKKQQLADDDKPPGCETSPPIRRRRRSLSRERRRNSVKLKFIENNDPRKIINIHVRKSEPVFIESGVSDSNRDVDSLYSNCSESGAEDHSSCFADSETSSLVSYDELIYSELNRRGRQRVRFCEESIIRSEHHEYKIAQIRTAPPAYDRRLQGNRTLDICQRLNDVTLSADDEAEDEKENDELVLPIFIRYPVKSSERTFLKSDENKPCVDPIDTDMLNSDNASYDPTLATQRNISSETKSKISGNLESQNESPRRTQSERASTDAKDIEELVLKSCFGNQKYLEMVTSDYESESVSSGDSISASKRRTGRRLSHAIAENPPDESVQDSRPLAKPFHEKDSETQENMNISDSEFDLYNLTTKTTVLYPHKALSPGELTVQTGQVVYVDPRELYSKKIWVIAYMVSTGECGFIPKVNLATRKMENIV
ncbi:uncharacterized protein LOC117124561 [Anneissia japonica]|uniref:uncharacterized protein LOC117124561 n=1 Tax=Anneissia japonica TaxID=1529436 RepID=UPI001425ABB6|nr:uncharacterized protein LOC117124561 [Anneissia japonica]XP_033126722.1 uncharacterized protein LOC117124561 [Anneissia japonica]XP_033126723.1 uncharacterized protein LOC117124561 [Anneissia japonica]XP_033126724.1 uncharacterized protein LOC117124561 [Anneissia japonica]XP_033126725.1 uncharacterized protein LOC117124561 [Anneissia japonica]